MTLDRNLELQEARALAVATMTSLERRPRLDLTNRFGLPYRLNEGGGRPSPCTPRGLDLVVLEDLIGQPHHLWNPIVVEPLYEAEVAAIGKSFHGELILDPIPHSCDLIG